MGTNNKKMALSSFDDMILLYKCFLRLIGLLPFENRNFSYLGSQLLFAYHLLSTTIYWTMFAFYVINGKKVPQISVICETVVVCGISLRHYLLAQHRWKLINLFDESRLLWESCDEDGRRTVQRFEKKVRLLFGFLLVCTLSTNFMYTTSAVMLTLNAARFNDTQTRYLPYKWYSENGPNLWPGYKIIFTLHILLVHNASIISSIVDSTGPLLIMIGAGYFRVLRQRILRFTEDETNLEILACTRIHQRILEFCSKIENIMRTLFLAQVLCTVYNLSLAGIQLTGKDPDRFKFLSIALFQLGQLFICQWAPDHLIDESAAISTAFYSVSFTWMGRRLGKLFVLVITRSQQPVRMTAGGFIYLSIENFGKMMTSAFSFFTVLRTLTT